MLTLLLDANVLIALFDGDHVHHARVRDWFVGFKGRFATCPSVQGALVRWIMRVEGPSGCAAARAELNTLAADQRHEFWADALPYSQVDFIGVIGHRQVTDAYLASLARSRESGIATLDRGLCALHRDVAELIPEV